MTTEETEQPEKTTPSIAETFGFHRYRFSVGKILVLAAALLLIVAGLIGSVTGPTTKKAGAGAQPQSAPSAGAGSGDLLNSFAESGRSTGAAQPAPPLAGDREAADIGDALGFGDLSPAMLRGGFGMFIGFAIGFAIRAFIRLAVVMVGVYFLILTLMAYGGWVEIHWPVVETQFNHLATNLTSQFESFKTFLTGSIPSAGVTGIGLVAGLKQK